MDVAQPAGPTFREVRSGAERRGTGSGQDGFALIVVIWAIGAIALLFTTYIAAARYRAIESSASLEQAKAEALADAGVNLAIADLLSNAAKGPAGVRFQRQRGPRACSMGHRSTLAIAVTSEKGKVDLNTAGPALLRMLLTVTTGDDIRAKAITRAILTLRDAGSTDAKAPDSGTPAPVRTFRSAVELGQVPGVSRVDYDRLAPFVTVHARSAGIDPTLADPALVTALDPKMGAAGNAASPGAAALFVAEAPGNLYGITAEARTATGARFERVGVVELQVGPPLTYQIREWRQGAARAAPAVPSAAELPPC